ncbi:DUF4838 domain-containing protein [Sphingobacterium sp. DK4209]|uniref:DUF4838 domain-containing protein n=2 Tax=Sphingobacterium zhuxiongii TaxID=2662364 RepID=A0A5Q0QBV0_9SPHI|nr:DUF4838 domain-containing protein [Sphingobacterium sp. DK4209]QGA26659.1 DUF4838 domain-containing protein [Sphingobacterium sp. dk4302]
MLPFSLILSCLIMISTACHNDHYDLNASSYVLTAEQDAGSEKWRDYLYNQLHKRSSDKALFRTAELDEAIPDDAKEIHVELATDLKNDYCIQYEHKKILIRVKTAKISTWMSYQLIETLGQVKKEVAVDDLPPAFIDFKTQCKDFDFAYREPHYKPNTNVDYAAILGTNNLDSEWGIWGHNITRIIQDEPGVWATDAGQINKEQFCFSSEALYNQLHNYILDNFSSDPSEGMKFMIAPNDNKISCTCDQCKTAGNTSTNAASAVVLLLNKLAKEFRQHQFFTIRYHSVNLPSDFSLEPNAGIFFSSIDLPKSTKIKDNQALQRFNKEIHAWKPKAKEIFLWDYSSNFDDYLTPLPSLSVLKAQLQAYKKEGVKGVFLNASGYDYSSFDDVKTYVSAALMINSNLDIAPLIDKYFKKFYPKSHQLLSAYYQKLESDFVNKGKPYSLYAGYSEVRQSYFNEMDFLKLNSSLQALYPSMEGSEQAAVAQLLAAFRYTRLQIAYSQGLKKTGAFEIVNQRVQLKPSTIALLAELTKDIQSEKIQVYKESDGDLKTYITEWNQYASLSQKPNQLKSSQLLQVVNEQKEVLPKSSLVDGILGFANDFHQGWLTSSKSMTFTIDVNTFSDKKELQMRFLKNERHQYGIPEKVECWQGGKLIYQSEIKDPSPSNNTFTLSIPLSNFDAAKASKIKISTRNPSLSRLGLDEVQVFN